MYVCMYMYTYIQYIHIHIHRVIPYLAQWRWPHSLRWSVLSPEKKQLRTPIHTHIKLHTYIHTYIHTCTYIQYIHTYIGNTCSLYIPKPTMEIDAPAPPDSETSYCLKTLYEYPCMYVMYACNVCMYVLACCSYLGSCSGSYVEHKLHALDRGTIR